MFCWQKSGLLSHYNLILFRAVSFDYYTKI